MSTFGYHKELEKYEEVDEDELLATLTSEELQELESELADIDPDKNVPIGLRQRDQTAKTPTANFSREALLKYWEDETLKLLDNGKTVSSSQQDCMEEEQPNKSLRECESESDSDVNVAADKEEENKSRTDGMKGKGETDLTPEKTDKCKTEPCPISDRRGKHFGSNFFKNPENRLQKNKMRSETTDQNLNVSSDRPCGNPIIIVDALEQIRGDDPTMGELNLNNIEDISQETLLRFVEALSVNTHVRFFSLANTHADDRVAFAISKMLRENRSITNLNIESNFVSGKGILALLASVQHNGTIVELRFHNQRHICGGQVEMEMVQLLRDNTTLLKLGYQFDLPGPRMTATSILTRNQDQKRQRRLLQQREQGHAGEILVKPKADFNPKGQVSKSKLVNRSHPKLSGCSQKRMPNEQTSNTTPPPPSPPPPPPTPSLSSLQPFSDKKKPSTKIADMLKLHEGSNSTKGQPGQKKLKSKKGKNGANERESSDILKDLRTALKPSPQRRKDEPCRLAPQRSTRDDLMEAIRGSSIRSLKRVDY